MKLYKSLFLGALGICSAAAMTSCSEEATLSGANVVYIELSSNDISTTVGDTVFVSAVVSNESGKVINTPVTWSIDDPTVAELVVKRSYTLKKSGSRAEGDEETPGEETPENPENPDTPDEPEVDPQPVAPADTIWTVTYGVRGMAGAQGQTTRLRATLENGQYAVALVSVVARDLNNAVTPLTTFKRSYQRTMNDTVWFAVDPFQLVDETTMSYDFKVTQVIAEPRSEEDGQFTFAHTEPLDNIYIDRDNKRVGVVYTGPRMTGMGECTLTLTDASGASSSATVPIHIYPSVSPGFEVNGKRPTYGPPSPSNIKLTLMTATMDINSTYDVGVCLGIDCGSNQEIDNTYAAELAGMMEWTVEGSAVVVEDTYADFNYESGYVSYLKVRSGSREGLSVITYKMPDTTLVCNLSVENYNISHPVDRIVVRQGEEEVSSLSFALGLPASAEVSVEPEASFTFHTPEITVADPSILEVEPIGEDAGYSRTFKLHRVGTTMLTITSLDKTVNIPVTVSDRVDRITWDVSNPSEVLAGTNTTIKANVFMASGAAPSHDVTWRVSDTSIATVQPTGKTGEATLTALAEGTVKIVAEYDGVVSSEYVLNVKAATDIMAADYTELYIGDEGDSFYLIINDDNGDIVFYVVIPVTTNGAFAGHYSGSDAYAECSGEFDDVAYDITIVDNGDGTYSVTGTCTLPNGTKVVMNGSEVFMEG